MTGSRALGEIIINLVMYATVHTFDGRAHGCISILGANLNHNTVELVTDNGIGIPSAIVDRIFYLFFATRLGQGGSRSGLTIVHQMVNQVLHGRIHVVSSAGQGSGFTVHLAATVQHPAVQSVT